MPEGPEKEARKASIPSLMPYALRCMQRTARQSAASEAPAMLSTNQPVSCCNDHLVSLHLWITCFHSWITCFHLLLLVDHLLLLVDHLVALMLEVDLLLQEGKTEEMVFEAAKRHETMVDLDELDAIGEDEAAHPSPTIRYRCRAWPRHNPASPL